MSNCIQLKTSVIKGIKSQLVDQFPDIESWLNHIMPKKDPVKIVRWYDLVIFHITEILSAFLCFESSSEATCCYSPPAMNTLKS